MADQYTSRLTPGPGWMFSGHPKSSLFPPFTGAYKGSSATNLGWKIHFDLKSALSLEDSLKEAGMDASRNIIDSSKFKSVAERYLSYSGGNLSEKQVAQGIYDTINFGRRQLPGGVEYEKLFPRITDIFDTADTLRSQGMDFKFGANTYGNWTAYPTSLERRDKLIAVLESSMGSRLEEAKNIESAGSDLLSRFTKGRFTTQYMKQVPEFTKHSWSAVLSDDKFQKLPLLHRREERVFSNAKNFPDALRKFLGSESALEEMMFGPKGYVSPYEDLPSLWKGRGLSFDIPGRTAITPITPHATAVTSSNIPNTPQLKQSPQPVIPITKHAETVLPVTQQGKPLMNIPGHGQVIDPVIFDRMRADRQADLDFVFKSTNPDYPNRRTASMGLDELRAAVVQANGGVVPDSGSSRPLTAAQSSFLEASRQEKLATDALARAATSETMKSVEEHGYLYHYAPKDARESILKEGMRPSQARTAINDVSGPMAHHATHVPENSLYFFTDPNYAPSAEMLFDGGRPDMYRVKIEPGMLDNMAVDPRVPIVGGRGSAVILPIKGDSILAELFAVDVEFDYDAKPGTIKGRTFLSDSQRARVQPIVKAATHGEAVDPRSVAPVQKAKPQAILPVTQQGKPVMNIPGHGQVIDPIEIATRRAQRQADLDEAFNPIQINQRVNAQRKAALPLKKANKAQRRAAKNARALELQKQREEGSKLARAEAERIKAERAAQQVTQPTTVSLSGAAKDRSTLGVTGEVRSKPIYVNPVTGKREGRPQFVGNRKGKLKVGQTREGSIDTRRIAGFEISIDGVPSHSLLHNPTIDAPTYEAYGSISDGSRKKTGMSHGEAVDYISKRVRLDGGTVGDNKSLYGFDQQVKKLIDDGIVSRGDVIDILKGKNQANEFGRILPRSSGAGIVSPPGQLTGMGNIVDLPKNAQQLISGLGLEDDMRLSYGEALLQSSRMDQQGGNLSTGKQKQLGRTAGLADKQAMMVDDEKIQTAARLAREEERLAPIRAARVQAVINRGSSELGETIFHSPLAPAAEQAEEVVRKAPISRRTMEKMMSSNMLAAGVAAGGLGLLYASNKIRGEREVGR